MLFGNLNRRKRGFAIWALICDYHLVWLCDGVSSTFGGFLPVHLELLERFVSACTQTSIRVGKAADEVHVMGKR